MRDAMRAQGILQQYLTSGLAGMHQVDEERCFVAYKQFWQVENFG